jgi:phospholipid/cholesterol/gamma-HCH transport system permease protein
MPFATIDAAAKKGVTAVQDYSLLSARALANLFRRPFYGADIITQADMIGVGSLPIVVLTGSRRRRWRSSARPR